MLLTSKEKLIRFYGRRKGRKLSDANSLALELGKKFVLHKSDFLQNSKILSEKGRIVMADGPFRSEFKGMGGMKSDWKIIPAK